MAEAVRSADLHEVGNPFGLPEPQSGEGTAFQEDAPGEEPTGGWEALPYEGAVEVARGLSHPAGQLRHGWSRWPACDDLQEKLVHLAVRMYPSLPKEALEPEPHLGPGHGPENAAGVSIHSKAENEDDSHVAQGFEKGTFRPAHHDQGPVRRTAACHPFELQDLGLPGWAGQAEAGLDQGEIRLP